MGAPRETKAISKFLEFSSSIGAPFRPVKPPDRFPVSSPERDRPCEISP